MLNVGFGESPSHGKRAEEIGLSKGPIHAACKDEERVISTRITHQTVLHQIAHVSVRGSGRAKVDELEVLEAVGFPSQHVRFNFVNRVPPRARPQSPNRVPASPSVDFGCSSDMEPGIRFELKLVAQIMVDFSTSNTQVGLLSEVLETSLEIIWAKLEVPIEFHDKIPVVATE